MAIHNSDCATAMDDGTLVGLWSQDQRYSPGAMADQVLVFLPDHRGFFEVHNVILICCESFVWGLNEGGTLWIQGIASHGEKEGRVVEQPGRLHFNSLHFKVEWEQTPRGEVMEVLTLGEDRGEIPWRLPEKFGLSHRDVERYEPPCFSH